MDAINQRMQSLHQFAPVLACSTTDGQNIYLPLDTAAGINLISLTKADELKLIISKTAKKVLKFNGQPHMNVLGKINTKFYRGSTELIFTALVVANLNIDLVAGHHFMVKNNVTQRDLHICHPEN